MRNTPSPATAFAYVHCDVPASMTLGDWRLARNHERRVAENEVRRERRAAVVANLRRCIGQR
jgi:hypothetical protein